MRRVLQILCVAWFLQYAFTHLYLLHLQLQLPSTPQLHQFFDRFPAMHATQSLSTRIQNPDVLSHPTGQLEATSHEPEDEDDRLNAHLPLPDSRPLMRSQHLFSFKMGIDARSLTIASGDEFFLFMELRLEQRWASFMMSPCLWVQATQDYNNHLEKKFSGTVRSTFVKKNTRTLVDKLEEIEAVIIMQIAQGNFQCTYLSFYVLRTLALKF